MGDVDNATNTRSDGPAAGVQEQRRDEYDARLKFVGGGGGVRTERCDDKAPATAANAIAALVAVAIAWCLLYVTTSPELMAVPGGGLASIFMVYVAGTVAGRLITKVGGLPPLLGMMLAGIALRNAGLYTVTGWCFRLVSTMR